MAPTEIPLKGNTSNLTPSNMSDTTSSFLKILFWAIVPISIAILYYISPLTAALLPLVLSPTAILFWASSSNDPSSSSVVDLGYLFKVYILAGFFITFVAILLQSILSYGVAYALFQSDLQIYLKEWAKNASPNATATATTDITANVTEGISDGIAQHSNSSTDNLLANTDAVPTPANLSTRPAYIVFVLFTAYIAAGLIEESLKYVSFIFARKWGSSHIHTPNQFIATFLAASFGFSTLENLGFLFQAIATLQESGWTLALTVFERIAIGSPAHALAAWITALRVIRRDIKNHPEMTLWDVLWTSVILHGTYDALLFLICACEGNIGWVHPRKGWALWSCIAVAIVVPVTALLIVIKESRELGVSMRLSG